MATADRLPVTDAEKIADAIFLKWIQDSLAGRTPQIESVGIAYMYIGAWVPDTARKAHAPDHTFHVGPHIMIVSPRKNQGELQKLSHDGPSGMPYVAHLPGHTDLYLDANTGMGRAGRLSMRAVTHITGPGIMRKSPYIEMFYRTLSGERQGTHAAIRSCVLFRFCYPHLRLIS